MRWFRTIFIIAAVCLAGLFVFNQTCIQTGDIRGYVLCKWLESAGVETGRVAPAGGIAGLMTGIIPCLQERYRPWRMTEYGHGPGMTGFWFGGFLMWIVFIAIVAVLVYIVLRLSKHGNTDVLMTETPLNILKKRYARGEISKEEFDEIRKDIET